MTNEVSDKRKERKKRKYIKQENKGNISLFS
jgi:hypothetical protein